MKKILFAFIATALFSSCFEDELDFVPLTTPIPDNTFTASHEKNGNDMPATTRTTVKRVTDDKTNQQQSSSPDETTIPANMDDTIHFTIRHPTIEEPIDNSSIEIPSLPASGIYIDKKNCTITKNEKTYKLYGKYKVVNSFPDLKVQVVSSFPDLKVQKVTSFPSSCGKFQEVSSFPDIKIQFVSSFPDIKVKQVTSFPGF